MCRMNLTAWCAHFECDFMINSPHTKKLYCTLNTFFFFFINNLHQNVPLLSSLSTLYLHLENCLLSPAAFFPYGLSAENAWPEDPKSFLPPCWPCCEPSTLRAWFVLLVGAFLSPLALRFRSIRGGTWNPNALPTPVRRRNRVKEEERHEKSCEDVAKTQRRVQRRV